jgi:hypothetical protein
MGDHATQGPVGEPRPYVPGTLPECNGDIWLRPDPQWHAIGDICDYATSFDAYTHADIVLGFSISEEFELLRRKWRGRQRSSMGFVELRLLLFSEVRSAHWVGADEDFEPVVRALHRDVCEAWRRDWPDRQERADTTGAHSPDRRSATLGIDLASRPKNTRACRIDWVGKRGIVRPLPSEALTDAVLLDLIRDPTVTRVGVDAPFGWPTAFIDALVAYRERGVWPDSPDSTTVQRTMELRATDEAVRAQIGLKPLSVSTDWISYAAMRCARLLAALSADGEPVDRSGEGHLVEVYPEAALRCWQLSSTLDPADPGSYKANRPDAIRRRGRLVARLLEQTAGWLEVTKAVADGCRASDHNLDALLCALIARAVDLGRVVAVGDPLLARTEGWIRLPLSEPLSGLAEGSTPKGVNLAR